MRLSRSPLLRGPFRPGYPAVNSIVAIPSSALEDTPGVLPSPAPINEYLPGAWPESIMSKWNGGALIYLGGQPYLAVWGCGHKGGSDNAIYKFGPLHGDGADAPTWSRHWGPSTNGDIVSCTGYYANGNPAARHTYEHLVFRSSRLYSFSAVGLYCNVGAGENNQDYFDFAANTWVTGFTRRPDSLDKKGAAVINDRDDKVYWKDSGSALYAYDFSNGKWTDIGYSGPSPTYDFAGAIDSDNSMMLLGSGANDMPHLLIDLTKGTGVQPGDSGAPPNKAGYAYERDLKRVVAHGSNSRTVYFFDTTARTWSQKQFWATTRIQPRQMERSVAGSMFRNSGDVCW